MKNQISRTAFLSMVLFTLVAGFAEEEGRPPVDSGTDPAAASGPGDPTIIFVPRLFSSGSTVTSEYEVGPGPLVIEAYLIVNGVIDVGEYEVAWPCALPTSEFCSAATYVSESANVNTSRADWIFQDAGMVVDAVDEGQCDPVRPCTTLYDQRQLSR